MSNNWLKPVPLAAALKSKGQTVKKKSAFIFPFFFGKNII